MSDHNIVGNRFPCRFNVEVHDFKFGRRVAEVSPPGTDHDMPAYVQEVPGSPYRCRAWCRASLEQIGTQLHPVCASLLGGECALN